MIRIDQLIPNSCLLCKSLAFHTIPNLCNYCISEFSSALFSCKRCAMPLPSTESICGVCINQKLNYDLSFSPFLYKGGIRDLLNMLKHHQDICALSSLSELFYERAKEQNISMPDLIIPIPLSRKRYFRRGFNQSSELAKLIAKKMGIKYIQALNRIKETKPQQGLNRKERLKNLESCFQVNDEKIAPLIRDKKIALIDDVITTGATMESASAELMKYKPSEIYAWGIARTDL